MPADLARGDLHVHSTFSDGRGTPAENLRAAEAAGLLHLGCVDHVRRDTDWVPAYVAQLRRLAAAAPLHLTIGVEAKILTTAGELDLPANLEGIDLVYAADHQWPTPGGPVHPRQIRHEIETGSTRPGTALDWLVRGLSAALARHAGAVVLAHPFSILPKAGLCEADLSEQHLERVAEAARRSRAIVEISERWNCPAPRSLEAFRDQSVAIVLSTDAHQPDAIGRYRKALDILQSLAGSHAPA